MDAQIIGRVIEVFIPDEDFINKIGFKIQVKDEIITIIQEQTKETAKIYREDYVHLSKKIIDNKIVYAIEATGDDKYE